MPSPATISRRRRLVYFLLLLAASFVAAVLIGFVKQADYAIYDFLLRLRPAPETSSRSGRTVVVAIDDDTLRARGALPLDRRVLAQAITRICAAKPSVLGLDFLFWESSTFAADAALADALKTCSHVVLAAGIIPSGKWSGPIAALAPSATAVGHVHSDPDEDGVIRQVLLAKVASPNRYWALGLECFREISGDKQPILETDDTLEGSGWSIPASRNDGRALLVNFSGSIPVKSLEDVLESKTRSEDFAGQAVLIGVTTSDDTDRKFTPVSLGIPMPGVEIHAHLLNTLLNRAFLVRWRDSSRFAAQLFVVAGVGLALYFLRGIALTAALAALAVIAHGAPYFFLTHNQVAPAFSLAAAFWIPVITGGGFQYWTTWRYFVAADATSKRLRRQMDFVTHEVRSPLTAIQGSGELMARYPMDEKRRRQLADLLQRESQRLSRMFSRFYDVERLLTGEIELRRDEVDLQKVVEAAVEHVRPFSDRKRMALEVSIDNPGLTLGDFELLEFAVYNLMSNAAKYSPEGSVVRITAASAGAVARVDVRDQGPGISREDTRKIFERFYRTEDAETSGKPGYGLGLMFVREIARHHGGEVSVASTPGEGSTFSLIVPNKK